MSPRILPFLVVVSLVVVTGLVSLAPAPASSDEGHCIHLTVSKVRSAEGVVLVAVFADEESYQTQETLAARARIPAAEGSVSTSLCSLPPGTYAVSVFHDVDDDEVLDTNRIGVPTEDFGFSNGAKARFGKPSFDKVSFPLDTDHPDRDESIKLQRLL